jgi:hypothetical protein
VKQKNHLVTALTAVLLALILLAAGLDGLILRPGEPFILGQSDQEILSGEWITRLIIFALIYLILLLLIAVPTDIWRHWQSVTAFLLVLLLALIGLMWFASIDREMPGPEPEPFATPTGEEEPAADPPPISFELDPEPPPPQPAWVSWLAGLILAVTALGLTAAAVRFIWRRTTLDEAALAQLAAEAQTALASLRSGDLLRDVIIRCYVEMTRTLSDVREIHREEAMTPREFEQRLIDLELPAGPVSDLTRLFEAARYGLYNASAEDRATAVASLEAIIVACQEAAVSKAESNHQAPA